MYTALPDPAFQPSLIAALLFGLLISAPASAFTPKPGAILSGVGVHTNVMFLIDPSYAPTLGEGQANASELFDILSSHPGYRYGVLAGG